METINKARFWALRQPQWLPIANVGSICGWEMSTDIPTAATNGKWLKFNPAFVARLNEKQCRFLVLHELMHVAFRHMQVYRNLSRENPRLANIATDAFINTTLMKEDPQNLEFIEGCVPAEDRWVGKSALEIYMTLLQEDEPEDSNDSNDSSDNSNDSNDSNDQGHDSNDSNDQGHDSNDSNDQGHDSHDWESSDEVDGDDLQKQVDRAIRQGKMMADKMSGKTAGVIGDLLKVKQDWRTLLAEFINDTCNGTGESTWARQDRRFLHSDTYMPGSVSEQVGELVIGFDTSGSCFGSDEMTLFANHVAAIVEQVRPAKVHVAYVDTDVAGFQTFEDGQFAVANMKPEGGGCTHLPVLWDYLAKNKIEPVACVFLTDGHTGFGTPPNFPVLWAMTTCVVAPYGTNVRISR